MTPAAFERLPIVRRDPGYIGVSLSRLPDQLADGWHQARSVQLPKTFQRATRVVVSGMGGSHLGADIVRSTLADRLNVPMAIVADYHLPEWVNRQTLVICCSYSGSTEETLACLATARAKGAMVVVITSGGKLAVEARRRRVPIIRFQPLFNPSGQPRLGVAYSLMAILHICHQAHFVRIGPAEIDQMIAQAERSIKVFGPARSAKLNLAKRLAMQLQGRIPLLIGAEWTAGNLHTWTNQLHENAKTFAAWYQLPDLNHHLLEGLRNRTITKQFVAVFVRDPAYYKRNLRRLHLTDKILHSLGARTFVVQPTARQPLDKAIELLAFGGYVSWYLAAIRKVQPAAIPTVDQLKAALAGRS